MRVRENVWFPDPAKRKGADWLFEKIYSRKFPELEHLMDVMEQIARECAGDLPEFEESIARLKTLVKRHSREVGKIDLYGELGKTEQEEDEEGEGRPAGGQTPLA